MRTNLLSCSSFLALVLAGCVSDQRIGDRPICDGVLNSSEVTVDDAFDTDGDGYFDSNESACADHYEPAELDCDDASAAIHPDAVELSCNGVDDDCDESTVEAPDQDSDGSSACDGDCDDASPFIGPNTPEAACDGVDNDCDAATPDGLDVDLDTYTSCDDCDDADPDVNPAQVELTCNGADDDCNTITADGDDFDGDGMLHCFDCDDADPGRFPGNVEVCEDGIDQDCTNDDPACPPPTWDGIWDTNAHSYSCASDGVVIEFDTVNVVDATPTISFSFLGSSQPGTTTGTITGMSFTTSYVITGLCEEQYNFNGSFTSETSFTGTLTANFVDTLGLGISCIDCTNQSFTVNGTR